MAATRSIDLARGGTTQHLLGKRRAVIDDGQRVLRGQHALSRAHERADRGACGHGPGRRAGPTGAATSPGRGPTRRPGPPAVGRAPPRQAPRPQPDAAVPAGWEASWQRRAWPRGRGSRQRRAGRARPCVGAAAWVGWPAADEAEPAAGSAARAGRPRDRTLGARDLRQSGRRSSEAGRRTRHRHSTRGDLPLAASADALRQRLEREVALGPGDARERHLEGKALVKRGPQVRLQPGRAGRASSRACRGRLHAPQPQERPWNRCRRRARHPPPW